MKIGDKIKINKNVCCTSQKTQKSLANKTGKIIEMLKKHRSPFALQIYIVKIGDELLPFCSSEIKAL
jgi:hypothetical protein